MISALENICMTVWRKAGRCISMQTVEDNGRSQDSVVVIFTPKVLYWWTEPECLCCADYTLSANV